MACGRVYGILTRRKMLGNNMLETPLNRCLTTFDLTFLALAQMIGAGIFVLTGTVAHSIAGPGVLLSFLIAGFAALLSALCYAEFGSLIPRTGSAYVFTYVILGEAAAFFTGWTLVADQIIGSAATARSLSATIDDIFDKWIQNQTLETFGRIEATGLSPYPDFLALVLIFIANGIVISGAKTTTIITNIVVIAEVAVLFFICVTGLTKADINNWKNPGQGGFLPFGLGGVISGAATCFFSYIGFDNAVIAGEEAKTPNKSIPRALMIVLVLVGGLYILATSSLTLMQPYYEIDMLTPFQNAFKSVGLPWAKYIVTVGSILAISSTIMAHAYAMPRLLYAMASDGMLFPWIGSVNSYTKTPVNAAIMNALLTGLVALFMDVEVLVQLYSVGILTGFSMVAIALMKFHFQPTDDGPLFRKRITQEDESFLLEPKTSATVGKLRPLPSKIPILQKISSILTVNVSLSAMLACEIIGGILLAVGYHSVGFTQIYISIPIAIFGACALGFFFVLLLYQTNDYHAGFRVPFSPLIETLSLSVNLILMFMLNPLTWARLAVWLAIGLVIYLSYSVHHSKERGGSSHQADKEESTESTLDRDTSDNHPVPSTDQTPHSYGSLDKDGY